MFDEPIVFDSIEFPNTSLSRLKTSKKVSCVFSGEKLGDEPFPDLKPGEFCQSKDGKTIYAFCDDN
jgi:hypothetical protein